MGKKIKHMGMTLTEQEHKKWHEDHQDISPEQHQALMEKMGISKEEDEEWHRKQRASPKSQKKVGQKPVNCFAIGGGFLSYCVKQGWLIQEGKGRSTKYFMTEIGKEELKKFGINV